jgi:hypothetical protein
MDMIRWNSLAAVVAAAVGIAAVGCGVSADGVKVAGEVTFQGQPVPAGEIVFTPASLDKQSVAGKIENGKYECRVPTGRSQVRITAYREVPGKVDTSNPGETAPLVEMYIPPEYNANSKLEVSVDASNTKHDFALGNS